MKSVKYKVTKNTTKSQAFKDVKVGDVLSYYIISSHGSYANYCDIYNHTQEKTMGRISLNMLFKVLENKVQVEAHNEKIILWYRGIS